MAENAEFVALSNLVLPSSPDTLNVEWSEVRNWLFSSGNCSNEKLLKAFVRTQIYRPLFFKHDNHVDFTQDAHMYKCFTSKWFVDHLGIERRLQFLDWPESSMIDKGELKVALESESWGKYRVPEDTISYFKVSNKFKYDIYHNPVDIVDNKFEFNDVEFYVVRPNEDDETVPSQVINIIYFNEFQGNTEGQNQVVKVIDNKFTLNGLEYVIEGDEISIDGVTTQFHGDEKEWKCSIVDDKFQFDGTWYVLVRDETTNEYAFVGYADSKGDNKLQHIYVTSEGYAQYKPWNLTFQFVTTGDSAWQKVQPIQRHQSEVLDRVSDEWCEFDDKQNVEIGVDKTYEWWLCDRILEILSLHPSQRQALLNLGNGVLYDGGLTLSTDAMS